MRLAAGQSRRVSAAGSHHRRAQRRTSCAVLHAVESWSRASIRKHRQRARAVRWHASGEPAVFDAGEWLPDRVPGMFRAVPLHAAGRSPVWRGDAVFDRRKQPLQRPATERHEAAGPRLAGPDQLHLQPLHGRSLERRTSCNSPRERCSRPCPASWRATMARAITTSGTISAANMFIELPIKVRSRRLGYALNGWQVSGTAFWHSGLPFSVLSTPYSANGNGIVQGGGPQFASVVPGVPLYEHNPIPGVTQPGTIQWLNPNAFVSAVDPSTGACNGGDTPQNCQFGNLGRNALRGPDFFWSDFYLTKWFTLSERAEASPRRPVLQCVQSSQFCDCRAWCSPAFPASLPRKSDSARSPTRPRRLPVCLAWAWAATARPA